MKIEIIIDTWYYLTFKEFWIKEDEFFIVGDQYKSVRHLIDRKIKKEFSSREQKLRFRKELFESVKSDTWYKNKFATATRKGKIFGIMYDFIDEFIEATLDLEYTEMYVALRNITLNGSMDCINQKNQGDLDEVLSVFCSRVKRFEAGIVDLPFSSKPQDFHKWILKNRDHQKNLPFLFSSSF
jgi:hypothetical protein